MTLPERAPDTMRETRAHRRIRLAVESRGCRLLSLTWEPVYDGGEMCGAAGGWMGTTDGETYGGDVMGLSVDMAIAWVDEFFPPFEPCDCSPPALSPLMSRVDGRPNHTPGCRWFLRYHLRWWERTPERAPASVTNLETRRNTA